MADQKPTDGFPTEKPVGKVLFFGLPTIQMPVFRRSSNIRISDNKFMSLRRKTTSDRSQNHVPQLERRARTSNCEQIVCSLVMTMESGMLTVHCRAPRLSGSSQRTSNIVVDSRDRHGAPFRVNCCRSCEERYHRFESTFQLWIMQPLLSSHNRGARRLE